MARPDARPPGRSRVVFFGSGTFAIPMLEALLARPDLDVVGVVTPPDARAGRAGETIAVPVATAARSRGIEPIQVRRVRDASAIAALRSLAPDLGVLADFGQLIPPAILELPGLGMLNVHPSLLPRHRGATPIPATILAGDATAGVSIMQMDAGLDTGPIVASRSWALDGSEDSPALERRAAAEGAGLLDEALDAVLAGSAVAVPQDPAGVTLTRPLTRESGRLDPGRPAAELERTVRAMRPWPGTFLEAGGLRVAVHDAGLGQAEPGDEPGRIVADGDGLALATADGRLLLRVVRPAGGRAMTGVAFRRGRPAFVGRLVTDARTGERETRHPVDTGAA